MTKRLGTAWRVLVLGLVLAGLAGCGEPAGEEEQPPSVPAPAEQPVAPPAEAAGPPAAPAAGTGETGVTPEQVEQVLKKKTVEEVYDPINRKDPFTPEKPPEEATETTGPVLFELRFYTLRAIAWGLKEPVAMFEDPNGDAFALRVGDAIGRERATISAIGETGVRVTTIVRDWANNPIQRHIDIMLKSEAETKGMK